MSASFKLLLRLAPCAAALATIATAGPAAPPRHQELRIIQTTEVRLDNMVDGDVPSNGKVRMLVLVDDQGTLQDLLLVRSPHATFTRAAVTALQEWTFEPAREEDQPVWTRTEVDLVFSTRGRVMTVRGADVLPGLAGGAFGPEAPSRKALLTELDAPLRAVQTVSPGFPVQLRGQIGGGTTVQVDFYIDETGKPRMPVISRSAHPLLSQAALDAIVQWRFDPPTRRRHPVIVRAKQEFVYVERDAGETASAPAP